MEGVTEGRIVHYVIAEHDPVGAEVGEHRPAMIVRTFDGSGAREEGRVNLQVFCDGQNDGAMQLWKTSVVHDPGCRSGTWHWIERA